MTIPYAQKLAAFLSLFGVLATMVFLAAPVQAVEYHELTSQQQADLSRFLGWVWGDGKPMNTSEVTGIRSGVSHPKYRAVIDRLLAVPGLGVALGTTDGEPDRIKVKDPWDFWNNALPPEKVAKTKGLHTGTFLKDILGS